MLSSGSISHMNSQQLGFPAQIKPTRSVSTPTGSPNWTHWITLCPKNLKGEDMKEGGVCVEVTGMGGGIAGKFDQDTLFTQMKLSKNKDILLKKNKNKNTMKTLMAPFSYLTCF